MTTQVLLPAATKFGQGNGFTGVCDSVNRGGSASMHAGIHPPGADTPLEQTHPPREQTPLGTDPPGSRHPPWSRQPPWSRHPPEQTPLPPRADTPPKSRLRHTVNERPVRILLECILVKQYFFCFIRVHPVQFT